MKPRDPMLVDRLASTQASGETVPDHWLDSDGFVKPAYRERAAEIRRRRRASDGGFERCDEGELTRAAESRAKGEQ